MSILARIHSWLNPHTIIDIPRGIECFGIRGNDLAAQSVWTAKTRAEVTSSAELLLLCASSHLTMVRASTPALREALRCVRPRPVSALSQQRLFGASARCLANDKQASFKSQLYESTQQRLKRERAEQERYAQYQPQSAGGRYAALMFGMSHGPDPGPDPDPGPSLTRLSSFGLFLDRCILPGLPQACLPSQVVDHHSRRSRPAEAQCVPVQSAGCMD